jgi:hypothetical protein
MSTMGQEQTSWAQVLLPRKRTSVGAIGTFHFVPQSEHLPFAALKVCLIEQVRFVLDAKITGQLSD